MNRYSIAGVCIVAGFLSATVTLLAAPFDQEFKIAKVVGTCTIVLPSGAEQPAKEGVAYPYGSTVKTGRKASLVVILSEGNEIRVLADTAFVADQNAKDAADKTIRLHEGRIQVKLDEKFHQTNKFTVETPSAICGAIGCEFDVETKGHLEVNATTILCTEGSVRISYTSGDGTSGSVTLGAGDRITFACAVTRGPDGKRIVRITMTVTRANGTTETASFWVPLTPAGARVMRSISSLFTSGSTPTPVGPGRGR